MTLLFYGTRVVSLKRQGLKPLMKLKNLRMLILLKFPNQQYQNNSASNPKFLP